MPRNNFPGPDLMRKKWKEARKYTKEVLKHFFLFETSPVDRFKLIASVTHE